MHENHVLIHTGSTIHDNTPIPNLIQAFGSAKYTSHYSSSDLMFFNSWFMTGLMHPADSTVRLLLMKRDEDRKFVDSCLRLATTSQNFFAGIVDMKIDERKVIVTKQAEIFAYLVDHIEEWDAVAMMARARKAQRLNTDMGAAAKPITALGENDNKKRNIFLHGVNIFTPYHAVRELMQIIAERLERSESDSDIAIGNRFRDILESTHVPDAPMQSHCYNVQETITLNTVLALRQMNQFLGGIIAGDRNVYLSAAAWPEMQLVNALHRVTTLYKSPATLALPSPAKTADGNSSVIPFRYPKDAPVHPLFP
jgi:hypothetical protein